METARHVSPGLDALQAPEPAHGTTRHSSGRQDMDLRLVKQAGDFRAPIIRDERHMMTTFHKFDGNGMGRNHMTARAPGCEYIMAGKGHRPLPFTTKGEHPRKWLRRVKATRNSAGEGKK